MTTTIVLPDGDDAFMLSVNADYTQALDGDVDDPDGIHGTTDYLGYGQSFDPGNGGYGVYQWFMRWSYTHPANEVITCAAIHLKHVTHTAPVTRDLYLLPYTYGPGTPDTSDWRTPSQLTALMPSKFARYPDAQASGVSQRLWAGSDELTDYLVTNGSTDVSVVGVSNRQTFYWSGPLGNESDTVASSQVADEPQLVVSSVPRSTLHGVLGAQVVLSDGTWAVLESDGATSPTITLRHVNAVGTATTKATIPLGTSSTTFGFGSAPGAQQLALVVDSSDNLYVIGRRGDTENTLAVRAYVKGVGYTWTAATMMSAALPGSDTRLNNFAAAWHSVASGTIVVFATRGSCDPYRALPSTEMAYVTLSASAALAGTGTLVRETGNPVGPMLGLIPLSPWMCVSNETGTGLDVTALSSTKGVVHSWGRRDGLGINQPTYKCRYTLSSSGTFSSSFGSTVADVSAWAKKTAAGKLRALPIDSDRAVFIGTDADSGWGITPWTLRNSGTSTSWTWLGLVRLDNEDLTTMPSSSTLAESPAWDATYRTVDGKVWVYYFDTSDGRRLMRTAMNLSTYQATREETEIDGVVGASGSTNLAIRTTRGASVTNAELVTVANRSSGGTHSTIYVVDDPNLAPTAPTLGPRSNFDASASARFTWTFNDPNPNDTQSAFQLDINTSSGVDNFDTGRLSNAITYVGTGTAATGNNTSLNPTLPASAAAGDLLLLLASIRNYGTGTVDTPTGWRLLASGTNGNLRLFGRHMRSGAASANNTPTVTFTGGAANATTLAQISAWRGTDQDISTVMTASAGSNFIAAQNLPWTALSVPSTTHVGIRAGWKQDDWSSVAANSGFTVVGSVTSTTGDDASMIWEYQTGTLGWFGGSWTVTGGGSAISATLAVAIRPYQAPTVAGFTLPASTLSQPGSWQWRVKTWDADGAEGAWSNYSTFSTGSGATVTITDPDTDNPSDFIYSSYDVSWSVAGATQADYKVEVKRTDTEATVYTSGWVTSSSTSHTVTDLVSDVEQRIEVTVRTSGLIESNTGTRLITPTFAAPETPIVAAVPVDDDGYTLVSVSHPTPTGDHPDPTHALILRRATTGPDAGEDWVTIGSVLPGNSWADYTAGAVTYEYSALAVAADGTASDPADEVEATLTLVGVWIHDPTDAANTVCSYPYGGTRKSIDKDTLGAATYFDGRADPVVDYGEHRDEQLNVTIHVPHGSTWRTQLDELDAFVDDRTTMCVRDARGRRLFAALEGYSETDQQWGTEVNFRARRVSFDETYTGSPV